MLRSVSIIVLMLKSYDKHFAQLQLSMKSIDISFIIEQLSFLVVMFETLFRMLWLKEEHVVSVVNESEKCVNRSLR